MQVTIKAIVKKDIVKLSEKIVNHPDYEGEWWSEDLADKITDAIELILDVNASTQKWLKEQGYLKD